MLLYTVFHMCEDCQPPQGAEMIHYFSVFSVIFVAIHLCETRCNFDGAYFANCQQNEHERQHVQSAHDCEDRAVAGTAVEHAACDEIENDAAHRPAEADQPG